jgi:hypothetical protein
MCPNFVHTGESPMVFRTYFVYVGMMGHVLYNSREGCGEEDGLRRCRTKEKSKIQGQSPNPAYTKI